MHVDHLHSAKKLRCAACLLPCWYPGGYYGVTLDTALGFVLFVNLPKAAQHASRVLRCTRLSCMCSCGVHADHSTSVQGLYQSSPPAACVFRDFWGLGVPRVSGTGTNAK